MVRGSKYWLFFIALIICYIIYLPYYQNMVKNRPTIHKLGYTPSGRFYKSIAGEYRWFLGDYLSFKSIIYYGGKSDYVSRGIFEEVEYYNLYRTVEASILLNPYNEDAYYFAQGVLTWDVGMIREVNKLLEYVAKYRGWDYKIYFFMGFNYAYFLKDYKNAAIYYQKASEISGSTMLANLAARYLYEGGDTILGINYLKVIIKMERKEDVRRQYELRLKALEAIYEIEQALILYKKNYTDIPDVEKLLKLGYLKDLPVDPYGGKFYIDEKGKVRTTSKMVFLNKKQ